MTPEIAGTAPDANVVSTATGNWLTERARYVNASEAPDILGVGFSSPVALFAMRLGLESPQHDAVTEERLRWGLKMERLIAEAIEEDLQCRVYYNENHTRHVSKKYGQLACTLDGVVDLNGERGALQIKNASGIWRDDIPHRVFVQVQAEMLVTGFPWSLVACLGGYSRLAHKVVKRDDAFIADTLKPKMLAFYKAIVERELPREFIDGSKETIGALSRLYQERESELTVELGGEIQAFHDELQALEEKASSLDNRITEIRNKIRHAIGTAHAGRLPTGGVYTLKTVNVGEAVRNAYSFRRLSFRDRKEQ